MEEHIASYMAQVCKVWAARLSNAREHINQARRILREVSSKYLIEESIQAEIDEAQAITEGLLDWYENGSIPTVGELTDDDGEEAP